MPKISIQYLSKTGAYIGNPELVESDYVPRVGELIRNPNVANNGVDNYFILSVINEVIDGALVPRVFASSWLKGRRDRELANFGWLQSDDDHREYDEDL